MSNLHFSVNGKNVNVNPEDSDMALIDFLHERLNLTGTKFCCGIGVCRACTVGIRNTLDSPLEKILSCSTPVNFVENMNVYTVEGLGDENNVSPLQKAFLDNFSFQCGYCTPGFLMSATALLERLKLSPVAENELDAMIKDWVGDNICRCTGYVRYFEAIKQVALTELTNKATI